MSFVPPPPILTALGAALGLPLLLAALSHGPWKVIPPGRRFIVAAVAVGIAWGASLPLLGEHPIADVAAGFLILLSAVFAEFTLWTLIAWGFTSSMLLTLARAERSLSLEEWVSAYTGGRTIEALAQDRLGVLVRFALATREEGRIVMTPGYGGRTAGLTRLLRTIFGLNA